MGTNRFTFLQNHLAKIRNMSGFVFFLLAAILSAISVWQHPSLLYFLYTVHNCLLAFFFLKRKPARQSDRFGLWPGLIAAFLPMLPVSSAPEWYLMIPALIGYILILWSLFALGTRFGIAPADRGLTRQGPYLFIRHPMYLGELLFRLVLVFPSSKPLYSLLLSLILIVLQCWRIQREEQILDGYAAYKQSVLWRLIPGIW